MMKYYVNEYAEGIDAVKGVSVITFDPADDTKPWYGSELAAHAAAIASFHGKLSTAGKNPDKYDSDLVVVINSAGGIEKSEKYENPAEKPVETTEEATVE